MNKFIYALAFVAVACAAASAQEDPESQAPIVPSNDEEVAELKDNLQIFKDFCINSRDYVVGDIKRSTNGFAAGIFNSFFTAAGDVGAQALETQRLATQRLTEQIANPNAPITEGDQINKIITDAQRQIGEDQIQPRSILTAIRATLVSTAGSVGSNISQKLDTLYSMVDPKNTKAFFDALSGTCKKLEAYNDHIESEFAKTAEEFGEAAQGVQLKDVNCITTKRILRLDGLCKLAGASRAHVSRLIDLS